MRHFNKKIQAMKTSYIKNAYFLVVFLLLGMAACTKDAFLNIPDKGSLTNLSTFSSQTNADLFVNDIYDNLPDGNNNDENLDQYTDNDFCGANYMTGQATVRSNAINPTNVPNGPSNMFNWTTNYNVIRKCNVFLQQAALNKSVYDPTWYAQRVGEIHYLRAQFYTFLYTNYGGVPLISVPLDNQTMDSAALFYPRSTADQTVAYIAADCDSAAAALPPVATQTGRASQGAALTLKGWVQLFYASQLSNPSNDLTRWAAAAATNLQVMNLGIYSLFQNSTGTGFRDQFLQGNNWNPETIFARGYSVPNHGHKREGILGPTIVGGTEQAWGNLAPTQNLIDDYEMDNGLPTTNPASGFDPTHPYIGREPRFYQSIVYDSSVWQNYLILTRIGGNNQIDLGAISDISNTGYYGKKTLDSSINGQLSLGQSPNTSNYIIFRYAEVLLSYAEAQNEAVGPDPTVANAVNLVRARVFLPAVPTGLSQDSMRTIIRRERRIELAFEDKRWFDIRRWDITTKGNAVLTNPDYGMQITPQPGGPPAYQKVVIFNNSFSEYMNWLPIPQPVLDQNKNLVQNPGY
jgi:starch-binding outer membrane protein, SusD/RagB family